MRRTLIAAILVVAVSIGAGALFGRLDASLQSTRAPVTLRSISPGALDRLGVTMVAASPPLDCSLPMHFSPCPVPRSAAEAAAVKAIGLRARVIESALALVTIPATASPNRTPLSGTMWVVAADRQQMVAAMCPCCPPPPPTLVAYCFPARLLAFVDASSGQVRLVAGRP